MQPGRGLIFLPEPLVRARHSPGYKRKQELLFGVPVCIYDDRDCLT
jgi:hypothetical protein